MSCDDNRLESNFVIKEHQLRKMIIRLSYQLTWKQRRGEAETQMKLMSYV